MTVETERVTPQSDDHRETLELERARVLAVILLHNVQKSSTATRNSRVAQVAMHMGCWSRFHLGQTQDRNTSCMLYSGYK